MARDLEAFGAPKELVEQWSKDPEPELFEIMAINAGAVRVFVASGTQWIYAGLAGTPVGLNYPGVESAARGLGLDWEPVLFGKIGCMERAALAALNESRTR